MCWMLGLRSEPDKGLSFPGACSAVRRGGLATLCGEGKEEQGRESKTPLVWTGAGIKAEPSKLKRAGVTQGERPSRKLACRCPVDWLRAPSPETEPGSRWAAQGWAGGRPRACGSS